MNLKRILIVWVLGLTLTNLFAGGSVDVTGDDTCGIGGTVTLTATYTDDDGDTDPSDASPSWTWSKETGDGTVSGTTETGTVKSTTAGTVTAKARYGTGTEPDEEYGLGTKDVTFVEVDKIEMTVNESQEDVTDKTIVVLRETKYTLKAIPNPDDADWPTDQPVWSYTGSVTLSATTGETVDATFDNEGTITLTCKCGENDTGKEVTFEVVEPEIKEVKFDGEDIFDKEEIWKETHVDPTACFIQNQKTKLELTLKYTDDKSLTYPTDIKVKGDTSSFDEYITGGDYSELSVTLKAGAESDPILMESTASTVSKIDYDRDVDIDFKYGITSADNSIKEIDLYFYIVWDENKCVKPEHFKDAVISEATEYCNAVTSEDGIAPVINFNIYNDYTYDYNCDQLSSNLAHCCRVLGVNAKVIRWNTCEAAAGHTTAINCTVLMQSVWFSPAGGIFRYYDWKWHQWAISGGKQYDPGADAIGTHSNDIGYEDDSIDAYKVIKTLTPTKTYEWIDNVAGQTTAHESHMTSYLYYPTLNDWK